jgi:hypothetical protein
MTVITVPEGVTFDAQQLMASMEDHLQLARDRPGSARGIGVVDGRAFARIVCRGSQGRRLDHCRFAPRRSTARGRQANTYQNYLVEHQQSLVGQAWLYSLAAALI